MGLDPMDIYFFDGCKKLNVFSCILCVFFFHLLLCSFLFLLPVNHHTFFLKEILHPCLNLYYSWNCILMVLRS